MAVETLQRVFILKDDKGDIELPDPNPTYTPEEVLDHYATQYPKLTNAVAIPDKEKDGKYVYKIKDTVGVKG